VTGFDPNPEHTWITLDDGSGRDSGMGTLGVKIEGTAIWGNGRRIGEMLRVQGSCSLFKSGSEHYPVVKVAELSDIVSIPAQ